MDKEWTYKQGEFQLFNSDPLQLLRNDDGWIFTKEPVVSFGEMNSWGVQVYELLYKYTSEIPYRFLAETLMGRDILERVFIEDYPDLVQYLGFITPITSAAVQHLQYNIDKQKKK